MGLREKYGTDAWGKPIAPAKPTAEERAARVRALVEDGSIPVRKAGAGVTKEPSVTIAPKPAKKAGGRPKKHASQAEKQKAYRERKKS